MVTAGYSWFVSTIELVSTIKLVSTIEFESNVKFQFHWPMLGVDWIGHM